MSLGEKLRNLRLRTRRTLEEQSKIMKVSMNSIYRWEHDLAVPRRPVLKMISDYYGVPLDWLMTETSTTSLTNETEQTLLSMFRKLRNATQYKVLGYVERICIEESSNEYRNGNGNDSGSDSGNNIGLYS